MTGVAASPASPPAAAGVTTPPVSADGTMPGGMMMGGKKSAWMSHVKATMRANKGKSLKQVLKLAGKTYKKAMRGGGGGQVLTPAVVGGRRGSRKSRKTRKSRRGGNYQ